MLQMPLKSVSAAEVARHDHPNDCWVIVDGSVYDVTAFLDQHPGGSAALSKHGRGGCDVSAHFHRIGHSQSAKAKLASLRIGRCADLHPTSGVANGIDTRGREPAQLPSLVEHADADEPDPAESFPH